MRYFLESWGTSLASRIKIVTYESLLAARERLPQQGGVYIFTNLGIVNRMSAQERSAIWELHDQLAVAHGAGKVLNDPARSLLRFDLLRHLHERGINAFKVYRASEVDSRLRLPAFLRYEHRAAADQPHLARNLEQYAAILRGIKWRYGSLDGFITVEFCDTADKTDLYRKYGAFIVGDRIVPRHIFFSRNWHIRLAELVEPSMIDEELAYVHDNPHADALLECARAAGIGYGRIDYGLLDGRPQIWEINTNASLTSSPQASWPARRPALLTFVATFVDALAAIDSET